MFYKTALHLAVEIRNIEIIKLLLEHDNIDTDVKNKFGKKPCDYTSNNKIKQMLNH